MRVEQTPAESDAPETAQTAAPGEPDAAPAASSEGRRLPGGSRAWLLAAATVVVVALVLAVVSLVRAAPEAEVRESALLAARTYTTSLTTFDARTLDEDAERVRQASTESFAAEYGETIEALRAGFEAEQTVSTGTVVGAGLEQIEDGTATVLVAVNQQLVNATGEARTEANRLRMVLERRDGRWLIGSVERL